ncbi:MAG: methyltransferase domain-containing protein [bacterium]|nr:methyltransferase domain-containing protein [bacterium]
MFNPENKIIVDANEQIFKEYLEDLKLTPEDLSKKILDVGSNDGEFAQWAKEHGVSNNIYSIDKFNMPHSDKGVVGEVSNLPFKDGEFDMVISHNAVPNLLYTEEDGQKAHRESIGEMLRVLRSSGEIRLGGVIEWQKAEGFSQNLKNFKDELTKLQKENQISIERIGLGKSEYFEGELEGSLYIIKKLE